MNLNEYFTVYNLYVFKSSLFFSIIGNGTDFLVFNVFNYCPSNPYKYETLKAFVWKVMQADTV